MINESTAELIKLILTSDINRETKTEIVKFWMLPRNTPVRPMAELPDEEQRESLGAIKRKSEQELYDDEHPEEKEEKEAMRETLGGVVDGKK